MKKTNEKNFQNKILATATTILLAVVLFLGNDFSFGQMFIYENVPGYEPLFKYSNVEVFNDDYSEINIAGKNDVTFYEASKNLENIKTADYLKFTDLNALKKNFYIVDKKTLMTKDYFDVKKFLSTNLKIKPNGDFPKVLIFHTHSHEMFADSNPNNLYEGIVGAGERLKEKLEAKGIKCIHNTDRFDVVDGKTKIMGAYERMEPTIRKVLADNPSIEIVIDMHRDGIDESTKLITDVNGKKTAKIMFFNGICRILQNGKLKETEGLSNPNIPTNLAFSFALNAKAKELYPEFSRGIYLNAYRYSLHMMPKSTLVEIGAQNNTKEEIFNAVDLLAEIIEKVVLD